MRPALSRSKEKSRAGCRLRTTKASLSRRGPMSPMSRMALGKAFRGPGQASPRIPRFHWIVSPRSQPVSATYLRIFMFIRSWLHWSSDAKRRSLTVPPLTGGREKPSPLEACFLRAPRSGFPDKILLAVPSVIAMRCSPIKKAGRSMRPWIISQVRKRASRSTTVFFPKRRFWALSTATASLSRIRWFSGRPNLVTSPTEPR